MKFETVLLLKALIFITLIFLLNVNFAIGQNNPEKTYESAMSFYKKTDYKSAAKEFNNIYALTLPASQLYDGACIYALDNDLEKSLTILDFLVFKKYYANFNHISTDSDLNNLHSNSKWQSILEGVKQNEKTLPQRTKAKILDELSKAKAILEKDNGKLWGEQIWTDDILILGENNIVYGISPFPESKTDDGKLYYYQFPENTFSYSNSAQNYKGKRYAVIMSSYLDDNSATIIHELFHIVQFKHRNFNGNPINYLDNYDAREWLRLEYQALRNCLTAINNKENNKIILRYLNDAMSYRKERQTKYNEYLKDEAEIETLEGLANYTGYKLSSDANKYEAALKEINGRENANTYTRPFAYATGLAYGLIFDYFNINWRKGAGKVYSFLEIYENDLAKKKVNLEKTNFELINARNNYSNIQREEAERKAEKDKIIAYFEETFLRNPTLTVTLKDKLYAKTFDMYGTYILKDKGTVYTTISGVNGSGGKNFGNFKSFPERDSVHTTGILQTLDGKTFIFPTPFKVEGNKVIGATYEIQLNPNWRVQKKDDAGNFEIVEEEK